MSETNNEVLNELFKSEPNLKQFYVHTLRGESGYYNLKALGD